MPVAVHRSLRDKRQSAYAVCIKKNNGWQGFLLLVVNADQGILHSGPSFGLWFEGAGYPAFRFASHWARTDPHSVLRKIGIATPGFMAVEVIQQALAASTTGCHSRNCHYIDVSITIYVGYETIDHCTVRNPG